MEKSASSGNQEISNVSDCVPEEFWNVYILLCAKKIVYACEN